MQFLTLDIDTIELDPDQVRRTIHAESIQSLAESIQEVGVLQPVLVKTTDTGYRLVAGERRLRAARLLGKKSVPAILLESGMSNLQVQLVENLQREDLNPVERAVALAEFMKAEGLSKLAASKRLGVPRTTLTDWLDILDVDQRYQRAVIDNFSGGDSPLTLAHISEARAFGVRMKSQQLQNALLDAVLEHKLSKGEVRQVTAMVRNNPDTSIEQAIMAIRRPLGEGGKTGAEESAAKDLTRQNLDKLFTTLQRSRTVLNQLGHVSPRHLQDEEKKRLRSDLEQLYELIGSVIRRIEEEEERARLDAEMPATKNRKKKKSGSAAKAS